MFSPQTIVTEECQSGFSEQFSITQILLADHGLFLSQLDFKQQTSRIVFELNLLQHDKTYTNTECAISSTSSRIKNVEKYISLNISNTTYNIDLSILQKNISCKKSNKLYLIVFKIIMKSPEILEIKEIEYVFFGNITTMFLFQEILDRY